MKATDRAARPLDLIASSRKFIVCPMCESYENIERRVESPPNVKQNRVEDTKPLLEGLSLNSAAKTNSEDGDIHADDVSTPTL